MTVTDFDVMNQMAQDNADIALCPDVIYIQKTKAGTQVTVGVPGDRVGAIATDKYIMAFYLINREQFTATKKRLQEGEAK